MTFSFLLLDRFLLPADFQDLFLQLAKIAQCLMPVGIINYFAFAEF